MSVLSMVVSAEFKLNYSFYSLVTSQVYISILFSCPLELLLKIEIVFASLSYTAKITLRNWIFLKLFNLDFESQPKFFS